MTLGKAARHLSTRQYETARERFEAAKRCAREALRARGNAALDYRRDAAEALESAQAHLAAARRTVVYAD